MGNGNIPAPGKPENHFLRQIPEIQREQRWKQGKIVLHESVDELKERHDNLEKELRELSESIDRLIYEKNIDCVIGSDYRVMPG